MKKFIAVFTMVVTVGLSIIGGDNSIVKGSVKNSSDIEDRSSFMLIEVTAHFSHITEQTKAIPNDGPLRYIY